MFSQRDNLALSFSNLSFMDAPGSAGVVIRMDVEEYLANTTHASLFLAERSQKAAPFLDRLASAIGFNQEAWKTVVWTGREGRVKVCKLLNSAIF